MQLFISPIFPIDITDPERERDIALCVFTCFSFFSILSNATMKTMTYFGSGCCVCVCAIVNKKCRKRERALSVPFLFIFYICVMLLG